jgi:hypothetical protein
MQNQMSFPKDKVLEKLRTNKSKHVMEYSLAMKEYWKALENKLETLLEKARAHGGDQNDFYIRLSVPQNHEEQYDTNIEMLEMTSETEITLTEVEFRQFILDEWDWMGDFKATVACYAKR